jgi:hypothetical protein
MSERRKRSGDSEGSQRLLASDPTRIDLLFTMSEITHAAPSGGRQCETVTLRGLWTTLRSRILEAQNHLVEPDGIEPTTSSLQSYALSQLSYGPVPEDESSNSKDGSGDREEVVGLGRFELPTSRLSSARSNQLSYKPLTTRGLCTCIGYGVIAPRCSTSVPLHVRRKRNEDGGVPPWSSTIWIYWPLNVPSRSSIEASFVKKLILRKEVIQPQVPLRLPCYDFTPVADPYRGRLPPLLVSAPSSGKANSHGVTGGVYKARERIHRAC